MPENTDTLTLPDGQSAELYLSRKIPERRRRPIQAAALVMTRTMPESAAASIEIDAAPKGEPNPAFGAPPVEAEAEQIKSERMKISDMTDETLPAVEAFNDAVIFGYVKSWTLGEVTFDAIADLDSETYDTLLAECVQRNNANKLAKRATEGGAGTVADSPDAMDPTSP